MTSAITALVNDADELGADIHVVLLAQKALNLAHRHAVGVHRHDLFVKADESALMLGDQQRLETAIAVACNLQAQRPVFGQNSLAAGAVALVAGRLGLSRTGRVHQVVTQLGAQCSFDQRFFNVIEVAFTASALMGPIAN